MLKSILGSSPRTTIIGYIVAVAVAIQPFFEKDGFNIQTDWMNVLFAVLAALNGRISKDSNGITRQEAKQIAGKAPIQNETIL